jgi:hypothetical protein
MKLREGKHTIIMAARSDLFLDENSLAIKYAGKMAAFIRRALMSFIPT